jgi:hypothetical protein
VDLSINDWKQIIKNYHDIANVGREFITNLERPKDSFMYPLAGTNWSGLLGDENPEILVQMRQVVA